MLEVMLVDWTMQQIKEELTASKIINGLMYLVKSVPKTHLMLIAITITS